MVLGRSERGSAASATTTSLARARSCAGAGAPGRIAAARTTRARTKARRFSMEASLGVGPSGAEFRIEHVAQPVPDEIDAERGERQRRPGEGGQPPRHVEKIAALREHAAPGRRRGLHAEAEA